MVVTTVGLVVSVSLLIAGIMLVVSALGLAIRSRKSDSAGISFLLSFAGFFTILTALGIISLIVFRHGARVEIRESLNILAQMIGIEPSTVVLGAYLIMLLPLMYKMGYSYDKLKRIREEEGGVGFFSNLKIALLNDTMSQLRSYFLASVIALCVLIYSILNGLTEFMLLALVVQIIMVFAVMFYVLENYKALEAATIDKSLGGFLDRLGIEHKEEEILAGVGFYFDAKEKEGVTDKEERSRMYHEVAQELSWHVRKQKKVI